MASCQRRLAEVQERLAANEAEVARLSLLDPASGFAGSAPRVANPQKLLILTNLGSAAAGSGFEGWGMDESLSWMAGVVGDPNQPFGLTPAQRQRLAKPLQDMARYHARISAIPFGAAGDEARRRLAVEIQQDLLRLPAGESLCLPGGYSNIPSGHAMYYRFEKLRSGNFRVFVYNAQGAGDMAFQGGQSSAERGEVQPYTVFDEVTPVQLFFVDPSSPNGNTVILRRLLELQAPPPAAVERSVDNIRQILAPLQGNIRSAKELGLPSLLIRTQRSGNCSVKSLNCLMLDLLGDKALYKRLNLESRLASLVFFYRENAAAFAGNRDLIFQLREATRNYLRLLNKAAVRTERLTDEGGVGILLPGTYDRVAATALDILRKLDAAEATYLSHLTGADILPPRNLSVSQSTTTVAAGMATLARELATRQERVGNMVLNPRPLNYQYGLAAHWQDLGGILDHLLGEDVLRYCGRHGGEERTEARLDFLEATVANLTHLLGEGEALPPEVVTDKARLAELLCDVLSQYSEKVKDVVSQPSRSQQRTLNTAMTLLALSFKLLKESDPNLRSFGIDVTLFKGMWNDAASEDPAEITQRNCLLSYFERANARCAPNCYLCLFSLFDWRDSYLQGDNQLAEGVLYDRYEAITALPAANQFERKKQLFCLQDNQPDQADVWPPEMRHLYHLRKSALFAYEMFQPGSRRDEGGFLGPPSGLSIHAGQLSYRGQHFDWSREHSNFGFRYGVSRSREINYYGTRYEDQLILDLNSTRHCEGGGGVMPENAAMMDRQASVSTALQSEWPVQTTALVEALGENLAGLVTDQARRGTWALSFFKMMETRDGLAVSPFFEAAKSDANFVLRFDELTKKALEQFVENARTARRLPGQPPPEPKTAEMLFVLRLRAMALSGAGPEKYGPETLAINRECLSWLATTLRRIDLAPELGAEAKLAQTGLFLVHPAQDLPPTALADFFLLRQVLLDEHSVDFEDKHFYAICQSRLRQAWQSGGLLTAISRDPALRKDFASAVLQRLGEKQTCEWAVDADRPGILTATAPDGSRFELSLIDGLMFKNGQLLKKHKRIPLDFPEFTRVFGSAKSYVLRAFGYDGWTFHYEPWNGDVFCEGQKIWRTLPGRPRQFLVSPDKVACLGLGPTFAADHSVWLNEDGTAAFIHSLKTGALVATLNPDGSVVGHPDGRRLYRLDGQPFAAALTRFDDAGLIDVWAEPDGCSLAKINFPRYQQGGETLSFEWNAATNNWAFVPDPTYHLDPDPPRELLDGIPRYLNLASNDGTRRKILIPERPIGDSGFSQQVVLGLPVASLVGVGGSLRYNEYEVRDGKLTPVDIRSTIYLAKLYLAQKRYQDAFDVLNGLSVSDELAPELTELINDFATKDEHAVDNSANLCAVRLLFIAKILAIKPDHPVKNKVGNWFSGYLAGLGHVEQALILPPAILQLLTGQPAIPLAITAKEPGRGLPFSFDYLRASKIAVYQADLSDGFVAQCNYFAPMVWAPDSPAAYGLLHEMATADPLFASPELLAARPFMLALWMLAQQLPAINRRGGPQPINPADLRPPADSRNFGAWYRSVYHLLETNDLIRGAEGFPKPPVKTPPAGDSAPQAEPPWSHPLAPETHGVGSWHPAAPSQAAAWDFNFAHLRAGYLQLPELPRPVELAQEAAVAAWGVGPVSREVASRLTFYRRDIQTAAWQKSKRPQLKEGADLSRLATDLEAERVRADSESRRLRDFIDQLASRRPSDPASYRRLGSQEAAAHKGKLKFNTLLRAACEGPEALMRFNPALNPQEAIDLAQACFAYMSVTTHLRQIERIIRPLERALNPATDEASRGRLLRQVTDELNMLRSYDPTKGDILPLLFEYLTGMRIRGYQSDILRDLMAKVVTSAGRGPTEPQEQKFWTKVFQLIMAGGKTSVIISNLVELAAETGVPAIVLSHHSQIPATRGNLRGFQHDRFEKDVYYVDATIDELARVDTLTFLWNRLNEAREKRAPILMRNSFPQVCQLKYVMNLERLNAGEQVNEEAMALLVKINKFFEQVAEQPDQTPIIFLDECDTILSPMTEVNIPTGREQPLRPERVDLVRTIYSVLLRSGVPIGLTENAQANLTPEQWLLAQQRTAEQLVGYPALGLPEEHRSAFIRYVLDQISDRPEARPPEDVAFLAYLERIAAHPNADVRGRSDLIALARQMLTEVLPIALSRSGNRHYGRDPVKDDGRVVPYLASDTPATTRFGYIYLALSYQLQTALNSGITAGELKFLAKKMAEAASSIAAARHVLVEDTAVAKEFRELTGVALTDLFVDGELTGENFIPAAIEQALANLNGRRDMPPEERPAMLDRRLRFESEVARLHVHYYPSRVCSTSINAAEHMGRVVACSGTLWNAPTYHQKLIGQGLRLEEGTEGQILGEVLEREAANPNYVRTIGAGGLAAVRAAIHGHPHKDRLRCLIDAGGLLKEHSNAEIAQAIFDKYAPGEVEAVVYLHKFSPAEVAQGLPAESFVLRRRGKKPILLKNTSPDELNKHGVPKERRFVIFDEARTTGTDIELPENALGAVLVDHRMNVRTLLQAVLRERGFFSGQDCEYWVTEQGRAAMLNGGRNIQDVVATLIKNEAEEIGQQNFRAHLMKIDNAVRSVVLRRMMEMPSPKAAVLERYYRQFLASDFDDNPYELFGSISGMTDPLAAIQGRAAARKSAWEEAVRQINVDLQRSEISPDERTLLAAMSPVFAELNRLASVGVDQAVAAARADAEKGLLPAQVRLPIHTAVEAQVQVEVDQEVQTAMQQQLQQQMQQQLQQLIQTLDGDDAGYHPVEEPLLPDLPSGGLVFDRLAALQIDGRPFISTVSAACRIAHGFAPIGADGQPDRRAPRQRLVVAGRFAELFPPNLQVTDSFRRTVQEGDLPIFHRFSKKPHFLLVADAGGGNFQFILVSEKEARQLRGKAQAGQLNGAWVVPLGGLPDYDDRRSPFAAVRDNPQVQLGLWWANFYAGKIEYLQKHEALSRQIVGEEPRRKGLFGDFLVLQNRQNQRLKNLVLASELFSTTEEIKAEVLHVDFDGLRRLNKVRQVRDDGTLEQLAAFDPESLEWLNEDQVKAIRSPFVLSRLPGRLKRQLLPEQRPLLDGVLPGDMGRLLSRIQEASLVVVPPPAVEPIVPAHPDEPPPLPVPAAEPVISTPLVVAGIIAGLGIPLIFAIIGGFIGNLRGKFGAGFRVGALIASLFIPTTWPFLLVTWLATRKTRKPPSAG